MHFSTLFATILTSVLVVKALPSALVGRQDVFIEVFTGLTGAIQGGTDFLTFTLVDSVDDCKVVCSNLSGCGFINAYHDINGKGGSPQFTCSLYATCYTSDQATNTGGQLQPDGSFNSIADSEGWCKEAPAPLE